MTPTVQQQIQLPLRKAVQIAWKNLRVRWWRSLLVTSGIILALAFLAYVLCSDALAANVWRNGSEPLKESLRKQGVVMVAGTPDAAVQTRWMVGLALLVSFVGILNAMLMSVTERFAEIGTMKCLGALDSFIIKLFLLESVFQGVTGTALGILAGLLLAVVEAVIVFTPSALPKAFALLMVMLAMLGLAGAIPLALRYVPRIANLLAGGIASALHFMRRIANLVGLRALVARIDTALERVRVKWRSVAAPAMCLRYGSMAWRAISRGLEILPYMLVGGFVVAFVIMVFMLGMQGIVAVCTVAGTLLTVLGALYPAWRAAKMQPVDAMRSEV